MSSLSLQSKKLLCNLIVGISESERKLEICRQVLCELRGFEPYTIFIRIDRQQKKFISGMDIQQFFMQNSIHINYSDIQLIVKNISKTFEQKITFEEFQDAILPKNSVPLKMQAIARPSYYVGHDEFLEYEIEMALARFFEQIAINQKKYDILKQEFRAAMDYDVISAFQSIDIRNNSYIDFISLDEFTKYLGRPLSENEIIAFIQYADVDKDMRLCFSEFAEILIPGVPSPSQTSPQKLQQVQSGVQGVSQSFYYSPSKQSQVMQSTAVSNVFTPSKVVKYPQGSPGGEKIAQQYQRENEIKQLDNANYQEYLHQSKKKSAEKKSMQQSQQLSSGKKSGISQSPGKITTPLKYSLSGTPLQQQDEEYLMGLLKQMITLDRSLQKIRTELTLQQDFNLYDAFRLFDINQNKRVSKFEIENTLNQIGIYPTKNELFLFFVKFDNDMDGYLSFGEFTSIFYSQDQSQINLINSRAPAYVEPLEGETISDIFSFSTRQILKRLFNQIFETESLLDSFRDQLRSRPTFNLYNAFNSLDLDSDGVICYEELKEMLNCYGIYTSEKDFISLFKRFDKDKDGQIKYAEFAQEITTKSPIKYFNK